MTATKKTLLIVVVTMLWLSPVGASGEPEVAADGVTDSEQVRAIALRSGWYCTTKRCSGPASAPLNRAASFGGAVLVAVWLARHKPSKQR